MTSLIEGADELAARGTEIGVRVKGLHAAVSAARGRIDDVTLAPAAEVVARAGERLRLSADHTVVALGGATGSGKSSTFNALVGLELSSVSVRRPTTAWASACTWGSKGAAELLEWLGIPARHQVVRDSMLDTGREGNELDGLVLLDMPDHDSTEVAHHLEVDRLVRLADLLIWVLDPQKYADAAIHDRFLQPLAAHKGVMMVVLNHIDEVAEDRRAGMVADLRRLLDADGLHGITLIPISAKEGIGVDDLRAAIVGRVADKAATRDRISTNLTIVAGELAQVIGTATPPRLSERDRTELRDALADAAGVPVIVDAIRKSGLQRGELATGWPPLAWTARLRSDPLQSLDLSESDRAFVAKAKATLPDANQLQTSRVDTAVRELADRLSADLPRQWSTAFRRSATEHLPEVAARLDQAVAGTNLGSKGVPLWTRAVTAVQWLLLIAAVAGVGWMVAGGGDTEVGGVPAPLLVVAGGLVLGLALALACRVGVRNAARNAAAQADVRLRTSVDAVADELVIAPLNAEVEAYRQTTEGLATALG